MNPFLRKLTVAVCLPTLIRAEVPMPAPMPIEIQPTDNTHFSLDISQDLEAIIPTTPVVATPTPAPSKSRLKAIGSGVVHGGAVLAGAVSLGVSGLYWAKDTKGVGDAINTVREFFGSESWDLHYYLISKLGEGSFGFKVKLLATVAGAVGGGLLWWGMRPLLSSKTAKKAQEPALATVAVPAANSVTIPAADTQDSAPTTVTALTNLEQPTVASTSTPAPSKGWRRAKAFAHGAAALVGAVGIALRLRTYWEKYSSRSFKVVNSETEERGFVGSSRGGSASYDSPVMTPIPSEEAEMDSFSNQDNQPSAMAQVVAFKGTSSFSQSHMSQPVRYMGDEREGKFSRSSKRRSWKNTIATEVASLGLTAVGALLIWWGIRPLFTSKAAEQTDAKPAKAVEAVSTAATATETTDHVPSTMDPASPTLTEATPSQAPSKAWRRLKTAGFAVAHTGATLLGTLAVLAAFIRERNNLRTFAPTVASGALLLWGASPLFAKGTKKVVKPVAAADTPSAPSETLTTSTVETKALAAPTPVKTRSKWERFKAFSWRAGATLVGAASLYSVYDFWTQDRLVSQVAGGRTFRPTYFLSDLVGYSVTGLGLGLTWWGIRPLIPASWLAKLDNFKESQLEKLKHVPLITIKINYPSSATAQ